MSPSNEPPEWQDGADASDALAARLAAADSVNARRSVVVDAFDGARDVGAVVAAVREDLPTGAEPERVEGESLSRVLSGIDGFDGLDIAEKTLLIDAARREIRDHY